MYCTTEPKYDPSNYMIPNSLFKVSALRALQRQGRDLKSASCKILLGLCEVSVRHGTLIQKAAPKANVIRYVSPFITKVDNDA